MSKLETNTIDTVSGTTTLQIGSTNTNTITLGTSGDTISVPTGASLTVPSGGLSGQNYPAFEARITSQQAISDDVDTKAQFDNEILDTDNCYDSSTNYRFTPTVAGKYYIYLNLGVNGNGASTMNDSWCYIYKNGSRYMTNHANYTNNPIYYDTLSCFAIIDMNGTTDYIEAYGNVDVNTGSPAFQSNEFSLFGGYRIGS